MEILLVFSSICYAVFLLMHEFDAIYENEWKMFKFILKLNERNQYLIFLYSHIFICGILLYYLWCTYKFINFPLLFIINLFGIIHLGIHLAAKKWKSNVFKSFSSFLLIWFTGFSAIINIIILTYVSYIR